ncbi:MAG: hypothetical protein DRI90_17340, partial [Deltaproteobacteria bacterium]
RRVPVTEPEDGKAVSGDSTDDRSPLEPTEDESTADEETTKPPEAKAKTAEPRGPRTEWLDVKDDFHGKIGQATCTAGDQGPKPATPEAVELRALVCETAAARIFTSMLTPNYDKPHFNHLHFEVTPEVKWHLLR